MRRQNQIEFFVRFKADGSLKCLKFDPYMYVLYGVVYQYEHARLRLICFYGFTVDKRGSQKTERIGNT